MEDMKARIIEILKKRRGAPIKIDALLKELGLPPTDRKALRRYLRVLVQDGVLAGLRGQSYTMPSDASTIVGILRTSNKGFGFVIPVVEEDVDESQDYEDEEEFPAAPRPPEIYVPRKRMSDAMNGDKVVVRIVGRTDRSPEGTDRLGRNNADTTGGPGHRPEIQIRNTNF